MWTGPLHFIDTPDEACSFDYSRDCHGPDGAKDMCVAGAIANFTSQLLHYRHGSADRRCSSANARGVHQRPRRQLHRAAVVPAQIQPPPRVGQGDHTDGSRRLLRQGHGRLPQAARAQPHQGYLVRRCIGLDRLPRPLVLPNQVRDREHRPDVPPPSSTLLD
ncbi:Endonuclease 1 [Zea mays]|uniref:Aspergillus nuclease S1 n=1 Tax=Zea mays TaxID=4577 RepID=A0A1D6KR60_MAIZE|nr:Endonuclease 1 [Zea mays]